MAIDLINLSKSYHDKKVLNNISLSIPKGKITSFIGPNGAGKSTLLSVISRLIKPESGEIILDNKSLKNMTHNDIAKKLSILKQSNYIELRITVKDLISFGRYPHSKGKLNKKDHILIEESIDFMDLVTLENQYIQELSGGQRQRAFIAMVLAQDTDYILLDEPLNNLDMKNSTHIMKILQDLVNKKNKTIVMVIHDINFASVYSDLIYAMQKGKIKFKGSPKEIMDSKILYDIFEFHIPVHTILGHKLGLYFIS